MDRLTFFKQGLSTAMDAVSAVVGLKKAATTFTEVVDEALSDIKSDIGLYMRSLDSDMYEGTRGTLKDIARMGYTAIETDSYFFGKVYDMKPEEFRKAADEAGLKIISAHLSKFYDNDSPEPEHSGAGEEASTANPEAEGAKHVGQPLQNNGATRPKSGADAAGADAQATDSDPVMKWWDDAIAVHKALGCRYIVISRMPGAMTPETADSYARYFTRIGDKVRRQGLQLCLHPTRRELAPEHGVSLLDILAAAMPDQSVRFEIDTREVHEAGVDMISLLKRYNGRIPLLHLQDYGVLTESGLIDFDKVVAEATAAKVKEIFVEVRSYMLPPKNCVERSIYNLGSLPSMRY